MLPRMDQTTSTLRSVHAVRSAAPSTTTVSRYRCAVVASAAPPGLQGSRRELGTPWHSEILPPKYSDLEQPWAPLIQWFS